MVGASRGEGLSISPGEVSLQAHTVPSLLQARLWYPPPALAITPFRPLTCPGVLLQLAPVVGSQVVPLPSWSPRLSPQAHTVPSFLRARLWYPPPAMAVTPFRPLTSTGVVLGIVVPLPNWP